MSDKEPEKLAEIEEKAGIWFLTIGGRPLAIYTSPNVANVRGEEVNTYAESFAQRRVDEAVLYWKGLASRLVARGDHDRVCSSIENDGMTSPRCNCGWIETCNEYGESMKSQGATNG